MTKKDFTVFDGLLYTGKPVIKNAIPCTMLQGITALPPAGATGAYYYDWEPVVNLATVAGVATQMAAQLNAARTTAPLATLGAYNLAPLMNYWELGPENSGFATQTQPINTALIPVARASDWLWPCLYTMYENDPNWWYEAVWNIAEARRISNKPLAPFWNPNNIQAPNDLIAPNLAAAQLQLIRESCDGIVLWGGYETAWDATMPWWALAQEILGVGV